MCSKIGPTFFPQCILHLKRMNCQLAHDLGKTRIVRHMYKQVDRAPLHTGENSFLWHLEVVVLGLEELPGAELEDHMLEKEPLRDIVNGATDG
jgi:hypothetical protein